VVVDVDVVVDGDGDGDGDGDDHVTPPHRQSLVAIATTLPKTSTASAASQ